MVPTLDAQVRDRSVTATTTQRSRCQRQEQGLQPGAVRGQSGQKAPCVREASAPPDGQMGVNRLGSRKDVRQRDAMCEGWSCEGSWCLWGDRSGSRALQ